MSKEKSIVTVLTVKTDESQQTIKGLKKEIADLKKQYDSAVIGSEEFEKVSKELATAQANLKTVMADGKKTTDAVEGSYNHLTATMAELKKEWKATADEVKRNDLAQQIDAINTELKDMDASIGNFQRNVGDYTNSFKDAFDAQQKSTENVRIGLDGLQKTASGLASGYAAVQGTLNLLNIESTEFEKAMIKVQSAMAIAQGVGGMKDLIEGGGTLITVFKGAVTGVKTFITGLGGVKKAIIGTGIGILVVALGTVIANWDKIAKMWRDTSPQEKAAAAVNKLNDALNYNSDIALYKDTEALKAYTEELKKAGGNTEKMKQATDRYNKTLRENAIIKAREDLEDAYKAEKELYAAYIKLTDKQRKDRNNEVVKAFEENKQRISDLQYTIAKAENEIVMAEQEVLQERNNKIKESNQTIIDGVNEIQTRIQESWGDSYTQIEEQFERDTEILNKALEKGLITAEKYKEILEQLKTQLGVDLTNELDNQNQNPTPPKNPVPSSSGGTQNGGSQSGSTDPLDFGDFLDKELANYEEFFNLLEKLAGDTGRRIGQGLMIGIKVASQVISILQDGIDTGTKEGFEKNKKYQKAQVWLSVADGIMAAWAQAMKIAPPMNWVVGAANSAFITSMGVIQTNNINKQKYNGDSPISNGGAAATPNINLGESMPIQFTRELLSDTETTNLNQAQRVIVLESDISDTQRKVEVAESNSSF